MLNQDTFWHILRKTCFNPKYYLPLSSQFEKIKSVMIAEINSHLWTGRLLELMISLKINITSDILDYLYL